jgi:hypothetical protein
MLPKLLKYQRKGISVISVARFEEWRGRGKFVAPSSRSGHVREPSGLSHMA